MQQKRIEIKAVIADQGSESWMSDVDFKTMEQTLRKNRSECFLLFSETDPRNPKPMLLEVAWTQAGYPVVAHLFIRSKGEYSLYNIHSKDYWEGCLKSMQGVYSPRQHLLHETPQKWIQVSQGVEPIEESSIYDFIARRI